MNSLSLAHDAGVQMIDTSIVRVHQRCLHYSEQKTVDGPVKRWVDQQRYMRSSIPMGFRYGSR
jgi:hypothetical protein